MSLHGLFDDAHRRVCISKSRGENKGLDEIWTGLGFPSEFKGAKEFFRPLRDPETPRALNWYLFTEAGIAEYQRRYTGKPDWFDKEAA